MATRTNQRAAKDSLTAAKRDQADANIDMGRHVTMCYQCSSAGQDTRRLCDQGWDIAKTIAARNAAVRRLVDAPAVAAVQGEPW